MDKNLIEKLRQTIGCGNDLAEVLAIRGYDDSESIQDFLHVNVIDFSIIVIINTSS